jgi:hypothetical protein
MSNQDAELLGGIEVDLVHTDCSFGDNAELR